MPSEHSRGSESDYNSEAERFLEANPRLREARIRGLDDIETIRAFVEYEARHKDREPVKEKLKNRMQEARDYNWRDKV